MRRTSSIGTEKPNTPFQTKNAPEHPKVFEHVSDGGELGTRTPDPLRVMQVL